MYDATNLEELKNYEGKNTIIGLPESMVNSHIEFHGKNNIVFFDEGVKLKDSSIRFFGNSSIVFISNSKQFTTSVKVDIYNLSVFYIGKGCNTTRPIQAVLSERKHIIIGDSCLFSLNNWFRNADPHLIYNAETKERVNPSKSIYIGDHVWFGQDVLATKGTIVGSGSIIGACAVTAGKKLPSNCSCAGAPARVLSKNIFWDFPSVHAYKYQDSVDSKQFENEDPDMHIYQDSPERLSFTYIEKGINTRKTSNERLEFIKETLFENQNKNRFFVPVPIEPPKTLREKIIRKLKKIFKK